MLGVVTAANLLVLFVAWELTSVTSYLLIGWTDERPEGPGVGAAGAAHHRRSAASPCSAASC